jgi:protein CpxP
MTQEQRVIRTVGGVAGMMGVAVMLTAMTIPILAADGPAQGSPRAGRPGPPGGPGGPGGRFGRGGLDLRGMTEAQREQVRGVREQHRDELRKLTEQLRTARQGLQASAAQGQVDEAKAAELGAATSALALANARMQSEIYALLTPEQRQQIQTRREEMRKWLESRPGDARRGPGGRGGRRQQ